MLWICQEFSFSVFKIKESKPHDRESSEPDIIKLINPCFISTLSRKSRIEAKPI